jgi:hypothetical protein
VAASVTGETPLLLKLLHSRYVPVVSSSSHPSKTIKHAAAMVMTMQRDRRMMDMPRDLSPEKPLVLAS